MAEWWMLNVGAQFVVATSYTWIAWVMLKGIIAGRQWQSNPVAVATLAIFTTCAVGHFVHMEHMVLPDLLPFLAGSGASLEAARVAHGDPLAISWHVLTACSALWYLTLRNRLRIIHGGQALCEDMVQKQNNAIAIHDQVMAGLARARSHLDEGDRGACQAELDQALGASRKVITQLLGRPGEVNALGPGDLRRRRASR